MGRAVKNSLEIIIEQMRVEGGFRPNPHCEVFMVNGVPLQPERTSTLCCFCQQWKKVQKALKGNYSLVLNEVILAKSFENLTF